MWPRSSQASRSIHRPRRNRSMSMTRSALLARRPFQVAAASSDMTSNGKWIAVAGTLPSPRLELALSQQAPIRSSIRIRRHRTPSPLPATRQVPTPFAWLERRPAAVPIRSCPAHKQLRSVRQLLQALEPSRHRVRLSPVAVSVAQQGQEPLPHSLQPFQVQAQCQAEQLPAVARQRHRARPCQGPGPVARQEPAHRPVRRQRSQVKATCSGSRQVTWSLWLQPCQEKGQ